MCSRRNSKNDFVNRSKGDLPSDKIIFARIFIINFEFNRITFRLFNHKFKCLQLISQNDRVWFCSLLHLSSHFIPLWFGRIIDCFSFVFFCTWRFDFHKWITFTFPKKSYITFDQITCLEYKNSNDTLEMFVRRIFFSDIHLNLLEDSTNVNDLFADQWQEERLVD